MKDLKTKEDIIKHLENKIISLTNILGEIMTRKEREEIIFNIKVIRDILGEISN